MSVQNTSMNGLVDKKVPLFNKKLFGKWLDQIKAECYLKPQASMVLSGVIKDPATQFALLYPDEYAKVIESARPENEEAILQDPIKVLGVFLNAVLSSRSVPGKEAVRAHTNAENEVVPEVPSVPVIEGISLALKLKVKSQIENWIIGEQTIYALLTKSLVNNKLRIKPDGAGRKQLKELEKYYNARDTMATLALDDAFAAFKYNKSEMSSLAEYAAAFQDLLDDCAKAKPSPIVHNKEQKFNDYIRGLRKAHMFESHITTGIGMKLFDWEAMHSQALGVQRKRHCRPHQK